MEGARRPGYSWDTGNLIMDDGEQMGIENMKESAPIGMRVLGLLLVAISLSLAGCGGSTSLIRDCCYEGDAVLTHLDRVQFVAPDGTTSSFDDIYPGYTPQDSFATKSFPFRKVQYSLITYDALAVILPLYDANKNGLLEEPEITVLYLREGALGMGHKVDHLAVDGKRVDAIMTSRSDVGGLMRYLDARMESLTPEVQAEFRDMERVGLDIIQRGSEGADRQKKVVP
jgi:hypothetical protein